MKIIDTLMMQGISDNVFPGGVLLVSTEGAIRFFKAYGYANIFSRSKMAKNTVFDLASLTKPLATTLAVMKLIERHKLDLSRRLGSLIPVFADRKKANVTIRDLLTHCSGLPDYRPYYEKLRSLAGNLGKETLRGLLVKEPLVYPTGKSVLYSDIGFMILEWVVENVSGRRLDRFVFEEVYKPLGLDALYFPDLDSTGSDSKTRKKEYAATEFCPWRNMLLEGAVHDDNAYVVGGVAGHAGLFGTALEIHNLLAQLLSDFHGGATSRLFPQAILCEFFHRQKDTDRALGFDTPSFPHSSCGHYFSNKTVGHLGFTGTSFWMDLERRIIVILLTNRVHPSCDNIKIKSFRPKLHDTVMENI
jgi:CubicO group peptidase (beta-lactamase class C family)